MKKLILLLLLSGCSPQAFYDLVVGESQVAEKVLQDQFPGQINTEQTGIKGPVMQLPPKN